MYRIVVTIILILMLGGFGFAQREADLDYLKSAFLYRFTHYLKWPDAVENGPAETFKIGVVGKSSIMPSLRQLAQLRKVNDQPIEIVQLASLDSLECCRILFIPKSCPLDVKTIINRVEGLPILTVGESQGWARMGMNINFIRDGDHLKFEINQKSMANASLKPSSQLLKLAILVDEPSGGR